MIMSRHRLPPANSTAADSAPIVKRTPPDRAKQLVQKANRDRDAALAREEYEADRRAVLVNIERLRALRLARDSDIDINKAKKVTKKGA
ncbi:hypothetical protein [Dongia rigui]|uniref:Uncharacterized protein n=1 Tax=Dongia rigui TaxID=940149 RepID=A0ABU5E2A8_9PROT|nr:hypothetical protein [Dongia rigui]MDY0873700.1 hypothetical protein [Dongia rigui]